MILKMKLKGIKGLSSSLHRKSFHSNFHTNLVLQYLIKQMISIKNRQHNHRDVRERVSINTPKLTTSKEMKLKQTKT